MGNNNSAASTGQEVINRLEFLRKEHLEHFGQVSIYYDPQRGHEVFRKDYSFLLQLNSSRDFLDKILKYNTRSPHLVQLTHLYQQSPQPNRICSQVNKIVACFQYLPCTLRTLIHQQSHPFHPFPQPVLWSFLTSLLTAQHALNLNSNYHGDIYPDFIYYDPKSHHLKLFDPVFFDTTNAGYHRALTSPSYLSPEILVNLQEKRTIPQFNTFKADVFSIGMVMLYCTSLTDPVVAYDLGKMEIDFYYLENLMRIAAKRYSARYVAVLRGMLGEKGRGVAGEVLEEIRSGGGGGGGARNSAVRRISRDSQLSSNHHH